MSFVRRISKLDDDAAKKAIRTKIKKEKVKSLRDKLKGMVVLTKELKGRHQEALEVTDNEINGQLTTFCGLEGQL